MREMCYVVFLFSSITDGFDTLLAVILYPGPSYYALASCY